MNAGGHCILVLSPSGCLGYDCFRCNHARAGLTIQKVVGEQLLLVTIDEPVAPIASRPWCKARWDVKVLLVLQRCTKVNLVALTEPDLHRIRDERRLVDVNASLTRPRSWRIGRHWRQRGRRWLWRWRWSWWWRILPKPTPTPLPPVPTNPPTTGPGQGGIHINKTPLISDAMKVWFGKGNQIYFGTSLQNQQHFNIPSGFTPRAGSDGRYWLINGNQQQLLTNNFLYGQSGPGMIASKTVVAKTAGGGQH